ncbi:hypothetical protein [Chitinophaga rhizosphaerae]|uniref:hypothetical protein n=1 Tax=Chitinophaga rhizosphaerae TaxID=1864947 RepID=UPI000F7FB2B4|nr:hypothetical protein [Chitinophaga rhizosphaerae]
MKSLFEIGELIDMHERRLEQYVGAYQRYTDKLTHLLFIYSAVAIFLMPITLDLFKSGREVHVVYYACYLLLLGMLAVSVFFAGRLIMPKESVLPEPLGTYTDLQKELEAAGFDAGDIERMLTRQYLRDMMDLLTIMAVMAKRKENYYRWMFNWGLAAIVPYIVCLIFHLIYEFTTT